MSKENAIDYVEFSAPSAAGVQAAKRFYGDAFGWRFKDWGDEYIDTQDSGTACGFTCDSESAGRAPLAVIQVADLEGARERVAAAGGEITREILAFPGGRRFHFRDPGGNVLAVWSPTA